MSPSWRIVLADDQALLLDGLTSLLSRAGHIIVGATGDIATLERTVRASRPDAIVLDSQIGQADAIAVIPNLVADGSASCVVLTADPSPATLNRALEAGAVGYMHKTRGIGVLLGVLERVARGEVVIEGSFTRRRSVAVVTHDSRVIDLARYLTPRERECLHLLTTGLDTTAMAGYLGVSPTTVRTHVQAVLSKLGVHSRLEAASLAVQHRLVPAPSEAAG